MIELDPTPTTKIAVAIDQGEIRTADGSAVEPISEIALELKRGEPAVLYDLALQFLKNAAIRIETRSKVERGYRLLRGAVDGPRAVRAEAVTLDRNMTVEAALQRFGQQCLRLLRWFAARGWRDQPISENATLLLAPISNVAPSVLERLHRKVRRRCKRFELLAPSERHRLRIALKKLRYTIEFLESLFDKQKHKVRAFLHRLKLLQDELGHANDVRIAYDLLEQMLGKGGHVQGCFDSAIDRAGGIVLGWHERDLADRESLLRKHVKSFKRVDIFW